MPADRKPLQAQTVGGNADLPDRAEPRETDTHLVFLFRTSSATRETMNPPGEHIVVYHFPTWGM